MKNIDNSDIKAIAEQKINELIQLIEEFRIENLSIKGQNKKLSEDNDTVYEQCNFT